ncbi:hypothetical protein Godav_010559, partial [Gossypium davidsonii]|nr:hypothetical protein [Gossypium davidsonii]
MCGYSSDDIICLVVGKLSHEIPRHLHPDRIERCAGLVKIPNVDLDATKNVRRRTDPSPDMDDPIVDENGQKIEDVGGDKLSYKSMLMGTSPYVYFPEEEEEFVHHDGDVVTKLVEGISSIAFSDRLRKFIERKMARTIIVKHLGRKIGFNALLKVTTLWSSRQPIQLMDLENGYYLGP